MNRNVSSSTAELSSYMLTSIFLLQYRCSRIRDALPLGLPSLFFERKTVGVVMGYGPSALFTIQLDL